MPTNTPTTQAASATVEEQQQHLREVHEHLRHAATSDRPEEIRERMRLIELALQRHEKETSSR